MQIRFNTSYGGGTPSESYAIIVAGGLSGPSRIYKPLINHGAKNAYRALRNLGYDDDHILYLNSDSMQDVDGDGTSEVDYSATSNSFTVAVNHTKENIGNAHLTLYLFGHCTLEAGHGRFIFDQDAPEGQQHIEDCQLHNLLLDESSQPLTNEMLIVVNSCHSESFITTDTDAGNDSVSADNRILIATTLKSLSIYVWDGLAWGDAFWHSLMKGSTVKDAFVSAADTRGVDALLDDNGDKTGHDKCNLAQEGSLARNTTLGTPDSERLELTSSLWFWKKSPGEMRVFDDQDNLTGLVNGEIHEDIRGSLYYADYDFAVILDPRTTTDYACRVAGTEEGTYDLDIAFGPGDNAGMFSAVGIPLRLGATHQYIIDWYVLSQGGVGVTVSIDADGDGVFEQTIATGKTLSAPVARAGGPYFSDKGSPVHFDASASYDLDGNIASFEWDFNGDGVWDTSSAMATAEYVWQHDFAGNVTLRVTDDNGFTGVDTAAVRVGLRRILSCDSSGHPREQYAPGQSVFVKMIGLESNTTYGIWIQDGPVLDGDSFSGGETGDKDSSGAMELVITDGNGDFGPAEIWIAPSNACIKYRKYTVVVDKQYDGRYNSASDGIDTFAIVSRKDPTTLVLLGMGLLVLGGLVAFAKRKAAPI